MAAQIREALLDPSVTVRGLEAALVEAGKPVGRDVLGRWRKEL